MAEVHPFRGVHYTRLVKDLSAVLCPPYDIITPQMKQELYQRSEYNFVRIDHGLELPEDTANYNKYTRAAATLEQWLEQGILELDESPAIYLHDQYFTYQGKGCKRRGIVVNVRLEEWEKGVIRPHEGTLGKPKSDRVRLLHACQANTSSILALFDDQEKISSLSTRQERDEPIISLGSAGGEIHYLWAITDADIIEQIRRSLVHQPLYIADGHHRYESALAYLHERRAGAPSSGDEAFNYVMMTLVDFSDPGLIILPPHRLVRGISRTTMDELTSKLKSFFDIEELPLNIPGIWQQVDDLLAGQANQNRLVTYGLKPGYLFALRLRDPSAVNQMIPFFHSELYKGLMVSVVDHVILENMLEVGSEREEAILAYSYDKLDAVKRVSNQEYQLAFLLSPVRAEVVKAIADAGDRMPRKSTYFYPKLPAGLIINRW